MAVMQLLLVSFLVNGLPALAEWEAAYQVWNQTFEQCREGDGDDPLSFMPLTDGPSQLLPEEAVTQWSTGMYEWINVMESSGSCLPANGTDDINHLKSLVAAAQSHPTTAVETVITAALDAYFLWAEVLFASGQGNRIVIPGYRENSTLGEELEDSQDVIRNAFNLWMDNGKCRDLNVSQCEQPLDNSSLTSGEPTGSLCGNLATEGTEECDDGNHVNGDGCSSSCKVETCPSPPITATAVTQPTTGTSYPLTDTSTPIRYISTPSDHIVPASSTTTPSTALPTPSTFSLDIHVDNSDVVSDHYVPASPSTTPSPALPAPSSSGLRTDNSGTLIDNYIPPSPSSPALPTPSTSSLRITIIVDNFSVHSHIFHTPAPSSALPTPSASMLHYYDLRNDIISLSPTVVIDPPFPTTTSLPKTTPLPRSRRKRGLFSCPDDCKTVDTVKAGSKRASNAVIKDSRRAVNPDTFKELTNGVALMAQTMTILGKRVPRVGKLIALQGKMAKAVLGAVPKLEAALLQQQGAAIWIRVTADCCKSKGCCVFWSRLVWRPIHNWFKCLPKDGTWFDPNDAKLLGANIIACIKSALAQKFQCTPGASRDIVPA